MVLLISFSSIRKNITKYCWLLAAMEIMLIYTFLSFLVLVFFLSFEMVLLLMSFLVTTWGSTLYKIRSSLYLFLFTVLGGLVWIISTVTLFLITGSNNYILDFSVNLNQEISFAVMFTVAFGMKVPVFPFHLWLPEVHSETDTSGSVLLAGVLLKVGTYGFVRFTLTLFPVGCSYWSCFI
jgi:NADH:ubiquinone oxidoreductase subunit 4 (subunit M)